MTTSWNGQAEGHQRTLETETAATARAPQLSGQRREDSVLFSLSDLQAMGRRSAASPNLSAPSLASGSATGRSAGSGLIDIQALVGARSKGPDALATTSALAGSFAATPLLIPITASTKRPAWVLPTLAGGGLLALALAVTLTLVLAGNVQTPRPQTSIAPKLASARGAAMTTPRSVTTAPPTVERAHTPSDPALAKTRQASAKKVAVGTSRRVHRRTRRNRARHNRTRHSPSRHGRSRLQGTSPKHTQVASITRGAVDAGERNELDTLLDRALKKRGDSGANKVGAPAERAERKLPKRLERRQIVAGMQAIRGPVRACFDRFRVPGMALLRVTIGAHGRVSKTKVSGLFAGTPTGACVSRAVQSARFPQAKNATTISYPFQR